MPARRSIEAKRKCDWRVYFAGMEDTNAAYEEAEFENIASTRQLDALFAHTGDNSARLNASEGTSIGPARSLIVKAGHKIEIDVYASGREFLVLNCLWFDPILLCNLFFFLPVRMASAGRA